MKVQISFSAIMFLVANGTAWTKRNLFGQGTKAVWKFYVVDNPIFTPTPFLIHPGVC